MNKLTLYFPSLHNLTSFSKTLSVGYLLNTNNFTLTTKISEAQVNNAIELYGAEIIETTDKVYSYDLVK